jgi:hypothetical protein
MAKKFYKGVDDSGETLYESIYNWYKNYSGSNDAPLIIKWIETQTEQYMLNEWDFEIIYDLIWESKNEKLITFLYSIGYEDNQEVFVHNHGNKTLTETKEEKHMVDRNIFSEWKRIAKFKDRLDIVEALEDLEKEFQYYDLNKRGEKAYERASEDFNIFIEDIDRESDEEVAIFFGIDLEIVGYANDDNECVNKEDVIGFCPYCNEPLTKKDLACFNETILKTLEEDKKKFDMNNTIGYCSSCDREIEEEDIDNEEIKMVVSI